MPIGNIQTVWSPDSGEYVTGEVYSETTTYICIVTEGGRQVGGPKTILLTVKE